MGSLLMCRAQSRGGLGCTDLWKYFLASHLIQLAQWHTSPTSILLVQFERISVVPFYIPGLLWSRSISPKDIAPLVRQSLYLWSYYKEKFRLLSSLPSLAAFLGKPEFPPAFNTGLKFASWTSQGLVTVDSLLQGSSICSFEHLQQNHAFHHSEPFENLCGEASAGITPLLGCTEPTHWYQTHASGVVETGVLSFTHSGTAQF